MTDDLATALAGLPAKVVAKPSVVAAQTTALACIARLEAAVRADSHGLGMARFLLEQDGATGDTVVSSMRLAVGLASQRGVPDSELVACINDIWI